MPVENELDVRGLCRALWHGKPWVVGTAALFAALALGVSLLMPQKWSAAAITASPGVNRLGSYYSQQQFLRNLAQLSAPSGAAAQGSIADEAYAEFTTQLASYDTRREFWLRSPYYQRHKEGSAQADAALLDELINQIVFTPGRRRSTAMTAFALPPTAPRRLTSCCASTLPLPPIVPAPI